MVIRFLFISLIAFVVSSCGNDNVPADKTPVKQNSFDTSTKKITKEDSNQVSNRSLADLEKAHYLHPDAKDALYDLAYAYAEAKNKKALLLTDTLLKYGKAETAAFAWYVKGTYYHASGQARQALSFYDSSIIADYTFLDSHMDKGHLLFEQKNYKEAVLTFGRGMQVASNDNKAEFFYWIGKSYEALGDKVNAKENYQRAYDLDKTITEAKEAAERL